MLKIVNSALYISVALAAAAADNDAPDHKTFVLYKFNPDASTLIVVSGQATVHLSMQMASHQERSWTSSEVTLNALECGGQVFNGQGLAVLEELTQALSQDAEARHQLGHVRSVIEGLNNSPALAAFIAENCEATESPVLERAVQRVEPVGRGPCPIPTAGIATETIRGESAPRLFHVDRWLTCDLANTMHPMIRIVPITAEYAAMAVPEGTMNNNLRGNNPATLSRYVSEHARYFQIELIGDDWLQQLSDSIPYSFSQLYDQADTARFRYH